MSLLKEEYDRKFESSPQLNVNVDHDFDVGQPGTRFDWSTENLRTKTQLDKIQSKLGQPGQPEGEIHIHNSRVAGLGPKLSFESLRAPPSIKGSRSNLLDNLKKPPMAPETFRSDDIELRDLVARQTALLSWYEMKYPNARPTHLASEYNSAESSLKVFKAYDAQLSSVMQEKEALERKLRQDYEKTVRQIESESQKRKQEELEKEMKPLQDHLQSSARVAEHQTLVIDKLSTGLQGLEKKLIQTTKRLENSVQNNRLILEKAMDLEEQNIRLEKSLMDSQRDHDRIERWMKAYQGAIEDYETCIRESGLLLDDSIIKDTTVGALHLTRHVKALLREVQDADKKLKRMDRESEQMKREHAGSLQKYMLELERKKAELQASKEHLQEVVGITERAKIERDQAVEHSQNAIKNCAIIEESQRKMSREKEGEIVDISSRSKNQLRALREQFDSERVQFQCQVDELQKSKIELQVELGHAMRERRVANFELESVHRNIELSRNAFKRDLGIIPC